MSNQDWPGPYWQQNENADAGRRSRPGSHVQDQTPWDDAGFWRSGDRQGGGEERTSRSGNSRGTRRSAGNGAGRFSQTADDLKNRLGIRGSVVGRGRSRADDQADEDFWGESGGGRSGGGRSGGSAARESSRGSRARAAGNGQDRNGYDANGRAANGRAANGRAANGYAAANGRDDRNGWDDAQAQGSQENGAGRGGYRGTRRAGRGGGAANGGAANGGAANGGAANGGAANGGAANGGAANGGAANGGAANGGAAYRGAANGGAGYRGAANGGAGYRGAANGGAGYGGAGYGGAANGGAPYRGAANGGAANGGAGYDENGTGEWSRRTALRERTARIGEGVRTRTTQRIGGGRSGDGRGGNGGNGWDGGRGGSRFDQNGRPLTRIERFKRYVRSGDWWRHWTWKKALGLVGAGVAAVLLFGAIGLFVIYEMTPVPTASQQTATWQSTNVYFSNGTQLMGNMDPLIGTTVDRTLLQPGQIPQIMNDAMIAAEDRNFMNEGGISITGLLRSAYEDVAGNGNLQGGSTITMQYAKNYYSGVDTGQNMSTKIKEIFIAMKLAHERSKQWILTSYLNTVPFGPTIDGVGAAAENYFGINLAQGGTLNYEQAAELAAMPNNPSVLSPDPANTFGYQQLQSRWHYVLTNMLRDGNITQQQFSDAKFPAYTPPKSVGWSGVNGYLLQMVEQQLLASKAEGGFGMTLKQIATGGYHIVTTFNMGQIRALARSVTAEKQILDQQAAAGSGVRLPGYDRIGAALINPKTGAITAIYGGPGYLSSQKACDASDCQIDTAESPQEVGSSFKPYVLSTAVNENMNVFSSILDGYGHIYIPYSPADQTSTELALSVLQPPAGATNDVVDGNSIGFTLPSGMRYYHFPEGADDPSVDKPLPVNVATATSSDPAFEDLAHRDGITSVIDMARDFGVGSTPFLFPTGCITQPGWSYAQTLANCNDFNGQNGIQTQFSPTPGLYSSRYLQDGLPGSPQIALGEAPLTAIEQASTFATLADDGEYHAPHVIASITSSTGPAPQLIVAQHRVLSSAAAADVDWALSFDNNMSGGTAMGTVTYHPGGIIAKTGTLGSGPSSFDAWFVGAVPPQQTQPGEAMAVTLYANDPGNENLDNLPITPSGMSGSLGGAWPASIWNSFFSTEWPITSYQQVNQVFPTVNGFPFVAWIQAKAVATTLPNCKPGQFKNCKPVTCKPGLRFGQPCTGGNPSPNPSCLPFAGQCNNPSPNPSGNPSPNPSGSVSPSPSTSCTPPFPGGTCVNSTAPGGAADQTRTTAALTAAPAPPPFVGAEDKSALLVASLAVTGVVT